MGGGSESGVWCYVAVSMCVWPNDGEWPVGVNVYAVQTGAVILMLMKVCREVSLFALRVTA